VSDVQLAQAEQALLKGATANGFVGELWTLDRIATVIEPLSGVRIIPRTCGRCCTIGWAGACSARRGVLPSATGRDRPLGQGRLAADAANAHRRRACLVFSTSVRST
jgi:hypothetical protein